MAGVMSMLHQALLARLRHAFCQTNSGLLFPPFSPLLTVAPKGRVLRFDESIACPALFISSSFSDYPSSIPPRLSFPARRSGSSSRFSDSLTPTINGVNDASQHPVPTRSFSSLGGPLVAEPFRWLHFGRNTVDVCRGEVLERVAIQSAQLSDNQLRGYRHGNTI